MMSAFRRPQLALKLLNCAWRNGGISQTGVGYVSRASFSSSSCKLFSSVKPKEGDESHRPTSNSQDPFGIEDVLGSANDSTLVQGFYSDEGKQNKIEQQQESQSSGLESAHQSPNPQTAGVDQKRQSKLAEYDSWLKQREQMSNLTPEGDTFRETIRETSFGQVRLDHENPAVPRPSPFKQQRGRGTRRQYTIPDGPDRSLQSDRERLRRGPMSAEDNEPIIETITADHSRRMRASDFLKQIRQNGEGQRNESEQENQAYSQKYYTEHEENPEGREENRRVVYQKIVKPRMDPSIMDINHPNNFEVLKEEALRPEGFQLPKEYTFPDYNAITQQDMWGILSKSVVFQNDFLLAINKPAGIPCHDKAIDCRHYIIQFLQKFADLAKCENVYPLHRLDKETTGVMLFAKDKKIASILKAKFAQRQISKVYLAATKLCPKVPEGTIKIPIGEGLIPGTDKYRRVLRPDLREYGIKPTTRDCVEAITNFKVVNSIKEAAFLEVEPVTGVKHQIRVHLGLGLGCPIIGDHKYSHRDRLAPQRLPPLVLHRVKVKQSKVREMPLHLHCNRISFTLPKEFTDSTEPVYIHAKIPLHMRYTLKRIGLIK